MFFSGEGDTILICVPSVAPHTCGTLYSRKLLFASAVASIESGYLIKFGANCTIVLIPSWKILVIVDFPIPDTLLMLLYEFLNESLQMILANRFFYFGIFWNKVSIFFKFLPTTPRAW